MNTRLCLAESNILINRAHLCKALDEYLAGNIHGRYFSWIFVKLSDAETWMAPSHLPCLSKVHTKQAEFKDCDYRYVQVELNLQLFCVPQVVCETENYEFWQ